MNEEFVRRSKKIFNILLVLSVIPMLWIAIYSRPFVDDYGYSAGTHQVWKATHSPLQLLAAIGKEVAEIYNTWQGSYSAIALFSIQPGIISEKVYGISTFILVGLFLFGNFFFLKAVIKDSDTASIVSAAASIILMQTLPHAIQGFYWWNGSSYYTLFFALRLIEWGLVISKKSFILSCVLGFFISGGNLVTGLLNLEVIFVFIIWKCLKKWVFKDDSGENEPLRLVQQVSLFVVSSIGFAINAFAPGNMVRAVESTQKAPLQAIGDSFLDAYGFMNEWFGLPVILLLVLLLPFLWYYAKDKVSTISRIPMFVLVFLAFCLFASMFTPTEYSLSEVGPRRIQNIRYYMFVLFMVLLELEAVLRTRHLFDSKGLLPGSEDVMKYVKGYLLMVAVGVLILLGVNVIPKENRNNLTSLAAARSILIGEAKDYAVERDAWTDILLSGDEVVTLQKLKNHPVPIYYVEFDITGDPENYRDESMCEYYSKKQIIVNGD